MTSQNRICSACQKEIHDDGAMFCPYCGAAIHQGEWKCRSCATLNDKDAKFCKNCGEAQDHDSHQFNIDDYIQRFREYKYFKHIMIALALLIVSIAGSSYYFNNMNEGNYLKMYAEAHRSLNDATSIVVTNTKPGAIKPENAEELSKQLQSEKDEIDEEMKSFTSRKPFAGYTAQHEAMIELLQKESSVLETSIQVIKSPLNEDVDNALNEVKDNTEQIKNLSGQINVSNTVMTLDDDITVLPAQLKAYVTEQRKLEEERKRIEAEKQARLNELKTFFAEMDEAIERYNSAKADTGGMMESLRNGGMIWADYFRVLNQARNDREGVRYKVNNMKCPQGTDQLRKDFLQVLDDSVRYCDVMKIGANLQFNRYYASAYQKEEEAKKINENVQKEYAAFIANYNESKSSMLNE
ncbi:zinc ribbon domain-containing protein [Selenomonas ruminantium]|nr:zinc ribbon domain-containing protein [Selenomonas ruminantium]